MSEIKGRLMEVWHQKVMKAERDYRIAAANVEKIQDEYQTPERNFALLQALKLQDLAKDEYTSVLITFTRLVLYGEEPPETGEIAAHPVSDLDIQEWVSKHHGFVPHPSWIAHCRELYLDVPRIQRSMRNQCPSDKRTAIRESFVALGLLEDRAVYRTHAASSGH